MAESVLFIGSISQQIKKHPSLILYKDRCYSAVPPYLAQSAQLIKSADTLPTGNVGKVRRGILRFKNPVRLMPVQPPFGRALRGPFFKAALIRLSPPRNRLVRISLFYFHIIGLHI